MTTEFWEGKYEESIKRLTTTIDIPPIIVGFNANIDAIKYIDEKFIEKLPANTDTEQEINDLGDLGRGIRESVTTGRANEWESTNDIIYQKILSFKYDEKRIGGQAGITTNLLSALGIRNILITPHLSKELSKYLHEKTMAPKIKNNRLYFQSVKKSYDNSAITKTNAIFEFKKGLLNAPRQNRFILSHRPEGLEPIMSKETEKHIPELVKNIQRIFLSGYANIKMENKKVFNDAKKQIAKIKKENNKLKIHLEYTNIEEDLLRKEVTKNIASNVHSIGMNETETVLLLKTLNEKKLAERIEKEDYSSASMYDGMKLIFKKIKPERLHIHNDGYYLCMTKKNYNTPEKTLNAHCNSALVTGVKAMLGEIKNKNDLKKIKDGYISELGLSELSKIGLTNGIIEEKGYYLIGTPNLIPKKVKGTVGLGDAVSSISFITDVL